MSATVPPTADFDRPSDFGEFWRHAEPAPRVMSLMPEAEAPVQLPLTPGQLARRLRMRRVVGGVIAGLLAFTVLAVCTYLVKGRGASSSEAALSAKPAAVAAAATSRPERAPAPSPGPVVETATPSPLSDVAQALAMARDPVTTVAKFEDWSRLVAQLSPADQRRVEQQLARVSAKGGRALREAARLELALLWQATARPAKAKKALVSLARTATDPVVKKYAKTSLASA